MSDYETRFSALGRLYGAEGLSRLKASHVAVIGLGGSRFLGGGSLGAHWCRALDFGRYG